MALRISTFRPWREVVLGCRGLGFIALLSLAACVQPKVAEQPPAQQAPAVEAPAPSSAVESQELSPQAPTDDKIRVALLVPITGSAAELGVALLQAAQMALFEVGDEHLTLLIEDTGTTPEMAQSAANAALQHGARLVLGPLFAAQVTAVAPAVRSANVPMISFSTDTSVAGNGVWVMGILPRIQVDRVVGYTVGRGIKRLAALAPSNPYGDAVVAALSESAAKDGAEIVSVQRYDPGATDLSPAVTALGSTFDAVLIPEGGNRARLLAPLLAYHDIDPAVVKFLGTALWNDPSLGQEPNLVGGWFAAPDPGPWGEFAKRYGDVYGSPPPRLASIAYDATALAAVLGRSSAGPDFTAATLTQPNGFAGVDGIFRLTPDGGVERGLAVLEMRKDGPAVIDPAPKTFVPLGY